MTCNLIAPQVFWTKWARSTPWFIFIMSIIVNIDMWFERFVIIVTSLHRDFLPSSWTMYTPTLTEFMILFGSFGLFFTLYFLFIRYLPTINMAEVKSIFLLTLIRMMVANARCITHHERRNSTWIIKKCY